MEAPTTIPRKAILMSKKASKQHADEAKAARQDARFRAKLAREQTAKAKQDHDHKAALNARFQANAAREASQRASRAAEAARQARGK